jgi:flagellar biosynthesis protein FlhF
MEVHTFIAESAVDAIAQIQAKLGPQAVVLNVRPLPSEGISRLWQKPRIEVLASVPEASPSEKPSSETLAQLRQELNEIKDRVDVQGTRDTRVDEPRSPLLDTLDEEPLPKDSWRPDASRYAAQSPSGSWRVGALLENSGLLPMHAQRIVEELRASYGDAPPSLLGRELDLAATVFCDLWRRKTPANRLNEGTHVLVGSPGVGKTVCLCKWLAQTVLVHGRSANVWRLDGRTANTAEALSVYSEILGIPVERAIPSETAAASSDLLLVDLPGVNSSEPDALNHLARQIGELPAPQVHLVLNAAYETPLLLAQARAFSALPVHDLIFTHLDEEPRWGKLWNVILGTNFTVSFLGAGQNIPGQWTPATPEQILARQFPIK